MELRNRSVTESPLSTYRMPSLAPLGAGTLSLGPRVPAEKTHIISRALSTELDSKPCRMEGREELPAEGCGCRGRGSQPGLEQWAEFPRGKSLQRQKIRKLGNCGPLVGGKLKGAGSRVRGTGPQLLWAALTWVLALRGSCPVAADTGARAGHPRGARWTQGTVMTQTPLSQGPLLSPDSQHTLPA